MKRNLNGVLKSFYIKEVSSVSVPPMPYGRKESSKKDNVFIAACIAAALILIFQPGLNSNVLRRTTVSAVTYEMLKDDFSRMIYNASLEYKNIKGVSYD